MTLQQLITWILGHLEFVVIGLVVLSTVWNFISGAGKQLRDAQARSEREADERRRSGEMSRQAAEANPDTQSYQGYLQRTQQPDATISRIPPPPVSPSIKDLQAEILEALGMKNAPMPPLGSPQDPQAELRRRLNQKMGRGAAPSSGTPANTVFSTTPAKTAPPKSTPRPPPRPVSKPIESQIEYYLDSSRPEVLERDSVPDSLGHSKRQPHFDLPAKSADVNTGGVALIQKPDAVNEVRGIGTAASAAMNASSLAKRLIDPRSAAQGVIWSEILGRPRSRRGR